MLKRLDRGSLANLSRRLRWSVSRISLVMGAFALVLIVAATGFIAWREREIAFREARDHAQGAAFSLADHAARLFEVADLALHMTTLALGGQDWDEAERSKPLWTEMRTTAEALPYVSDLWLNDETGRLRVGSLTFPIAPSTVADRPSFVAARDGDRGLLIGDPLVGRLTRAPTFLIARRLSIGDDQFRGIVSATADLAYFTGYWRRLDLPNDEHVALVRPASDRVLVQYPDTAAPPQATDPGLEPAVADRSAMGPYAPAPGRSGYYHEVGTLPLYITVSFSKGAVEKAWRRWLWRFLVFPLSALLATAAIMALARRQSRVEALAAYDVQRARGLLASANQRLEQRVAERTADLRESNAEIQRFAYIVSHDLRAPLVNIMGFTSELQRLRHDLFPTVDGAAVETAPTAITVSGANIEQGMTLRDDFDEAIGFIQTSIDKMDRLIKAILMLARQGQRVFAPEPVDMETLMRSIADGVAHRTQSSGTTVTIAPLPPLTVDRIAVEQVFSNLIDNAVKYLRPGVPGRIEITAEIMGRKAEFRVADNGRGVAPEDNGRVFELFRRSGPQTQPGDGIGLAHVRTLVRQLGGNISLVSSLGRGSTFSVILPLTPEG